MNYRHSYHAGNFADVFKHIILMALTSTLLRKDKAFCYLDTHAGIGLYDLRSNAAQKSQEFVNGIQKVREQKDPPPLIQEYLRCVQTLPAHHYPGSPYIVQQLLRPQDRMVLTELHGEDWQQLKNNFYYDKQVAVHHHDAYQALKAFLPPKERRGLVLIDPPYEIPNELTQITTALTEAVKRWDTGIYALWYPIKERRSIERFHQTLKQKISQPMLVVELSIYPENLNTHLNGNGMLIVNPPWQIDQQIKDVLPWLWKTLSPTGQGRYDIKALAC
jgi:23S rRNA (adenine2030-N6)-methyltransferase